MKDLNIFENGRQTQFFQMEDDLNFFQMEDKLNFVLVNLGIRFLVCNIVSTKLDEKWKTTSFFLKM